MDDYADYYYSVTSAEATPTRPAYQAGASTSTAVKLRWGYALSDKWLLTGKVGLEKLGSEITASPIVDRDRTWSAGIALAYNANVFQPREYDGPSPRAAQFDLRISGFRDKIDTKVVRDTSDGIPGFETDIEDFLGASDEETVLQVDATVRIGHYHRLEFGYFEVGRDSTTTLNNDLSFGDELFPAGTGAHASVFLGEKTTLGAKLQLFRTDFYYCRLLNPVQKRLDVHGIRNINNECADQRNDRKCLGLCPATPYKTSRKTPVQLPSLEPSRISVRQLS